MNKGQSVTWEARPGGGTWNWDRAYFSATFNSPATFKALKPGLSTITYTVDGVVTHSIKVTIKEAALPLVAGMWMSLRKRAGDR